MADTLSPTQADVVVEQRHIDFAEWLKGHPLANVAEAAARFERDYLASRPAGLREALRKCRDQFEFYVQSHMTKQPPDMDKAATNQEFVELCDAALSAPPPSPEGDVVERVAELESVILRALTRARLPQSVTRSKFITFQAADYHALVEAVTGVAAPAALGKVSREGEG